MVTSENVFITQFNFKKVIPKELPKDVYKNINDLVKYSEIKWIFNDNELHQFVRLWSILENPEFLLKHYTSNIDKAKPEAYNSYHINKDCIELSKSYLDYSIDTPDKKLREIISSKIRYAFKDYTYGSSSKKIRFDFKDNNSKYIDDNGEEHLKGDIPLPLYKDVMKIKNQYGNLIGNIFDVIPNSGMFSYENLSLEGVEEAIENIISGSEKFRNGNEFLKRKIKNITYADIHTLKKMKGDNERVWVGKYKEPLSNLIQNYYWIKLNPSLSVEKTVLDSLGFRSCKRCIN